jgi:hypothetical protein
MANMAHWAALFLMLISIQAQGSKSSTLPTRVLPLLQHARPSFTDAHIALKACPLLFADPCGSQIIDARDFRILLTHCPCTVPPLYSVLKLF